MKYITLAVENFLSLSAAPVHVTPELYLFLAQDDRLRTEFNAGLPLDRVFSVYSTGIATARDSLTVHFTRADLHATVRELSGLQVEQARRRFELGPDTNDWKVGLAINDLKRTGFGVQNEREYQYRPFDRRYTYYTGKPRGILCNPRWPVMRHLLDGSNAALCSAKSVETGDEYAHVFTTNVIADHHCVSLKEVNYVFPLLIYPEDVSASKEERGLFHDGMATTPTHNFTTDFLLHVQERLGLSVACESQDTADYIEAHDLLAYIYSVLHSRSFRERYAAFLRKEFARVVVTNDSALFKTLVGLGSELIAFHLMDSPKLDHFDTMYTGPKSPEVGRVGWSDDTVWLDAEKTIAREGHRAARPGTMGFLGVSEAVWNFHVGGYQVCHKWLKDRKGRLLSKDDIAHYQKIIVALSETIRLMQEIDEVIERHGGWPGAFQTGETKAAAVSVVPFRPPTVEPKPEERYVTCVPLVPLKAAAGAFGNPQQIDEDDFEWTAVDTRHRLRPGMFVAQVVGKSMEPAIPDGAYCLFASPIEGTRQGKTVLVQLRDATDPETGQRYTIKRYESEKAKRGDSWRHTRITLKPVNPDCEPIVLTDRDDGELEVIAEMIEVISPHRDTEDLPVEQRE
jgi:SOS-response transcriptional repressor LexA